MSRLSFTQRRSWYQFDEWSSTKSFTYSCTSTNVWRNFGGISWIKTAAAVLRVYFIRTGFVSDFQCASFGRFIQSGRRRLDIPPKFSQGPCPWLCFGHRVFLFATTCKPLHCGSKAPSPVNLQRTTLIEQHYFQQRKLRDSFTTSEWPEGPPSAPECWFPAQGTVFSRLCRQYVDFKQFRKLVEQPLTDKNTSRSSKVRRWKLRQYSVSFIHQ